MNMLWVEILNRICVNTNSISQRGIDVTWKRNPDTINADSPIYNSRVLKLYLDYLEQHHPEADTDAILSYARINRHDLDDLGHWFSQRQTDRFQEIVDQQTADPDVACMAGRHTALSQTGGPVRQYVLSLVKLSSVYLLMDRLCKLWSKGATFETRKLSRNRVELKSVPAPGVQEKMYQCENRTGTLEAIAANFTGKLAHIEHPECFHRGDPCCRYIISWTQSPALTWKLVRNLTALIGILASAVGFLTLPFNQSVLLLSGSVMAWLAVGLYAERARSQDLSLRINTQGSASKDLLSEINARTNDALITKEIGHATSGVTDVDELLHAVVSILKQYLDYDRGIIMLANEKALQLEYRTGFGHSLEDETYLKSNPFNLQDTAVEEFAVRVFKEKRAFMANDLSEIKERFPDTTIATAERIGVSSFICLPIVYKDSALGVLAVENVQRKRPYRTRDLNFLLGIAAQIAISIANVRTLKKLAENEKQYRTLFDTAFSSLYVFTENGHLLDINDATIAMQGYTLAEMHTAPREKLIHPESLVDFNSIIAKVVTGETITGTGRCFHKSGTVIDVEYHRRAFTIGGEKRFLLSARNMTDRIKAEREKHEYEVKLARARKMEALGLLAGGVAHDLNNILSGVVSYPELLLMDLPEESPLRKPIEMIHDSGQRAAAVVADLVTIARGVASSRKVVNINDMVAEYLASPEYVTLKTIYPRISVRTVLAPDLLNTSCSTVHIKKALMNLVVNAAEAMENGGEVCITTTNRYLDTPLKGYDNIQIGEYAVVSVSDQGTGISAEDTERIFEPFYTRKIMGRSGTGLGLTIVWNTLQDHQGYIDVASSPDGIAFHLYFPITRKPLPTTDIPSLPVATYSGQGETVLVVDDEENQRVIACDLLSKLGYAATALPDGETALQYLTDHRVDLLVLDMIMEPGINGRETYAASLELNPGQKAIIASGFSDTREVKAAQKLGAGRFVKKPYTLETIGLAVKRELEKN